jgi:hypothetical protein
MKTTKYFDNLKSRPDRSAIKPAWIQFVCNNPIKTYVQSDGRIRKWAQIQEMDGKYLRVVLLEDNETVHNAFFDRRFRP